MKAMILAAGLGTRLRPLTDDRPKALVTIHGQTMLEIALRRLREFGVSDIIVNVHHYADMVIAYLADNRNFGMRIEISREDVLLDTGGGLKKAAPFFLDGSKSADDPFLVHNVDVLSTIDLGSMVRFHAEHQPLATLAVQQRATSRPLLFDGQGQLCGRITGRDGQVEMARSAETTQTLAFCGIHVFSPRIFSALSEEGAFSIVPAYMRLAGRGESILAFPADEYYWRDLGKPESVAQAARDLDNGLYS